jgi:hypothetical protein
MPGWPTFRDVVFRSPAFPFLGRCAEEYGLSNRHSTAASDRAVDSRVVLVRTNDRLHHFRRRICRAGIKVHHRAAFVAQRDGDGGGVFRGVVPLAEGSPFSRPKFALSIRPHGSFQKRFRSSSTDRLILQPVCWGSRFGDVFGKTALRCQYLECVRNPCPAETSKP